MARQTGPSGRLTHNAGVPLVFFFFVPARGREVARRRRRRRRERRRDRRGCRALQVCVFQHATRGASRARAEMATGCGPQLCGGGERPLPVCSPRDLGRALPALPRFGTRDRQRTPRRSSATRALSSLSLSLSLSLSALTFLLCVSPFRVSGGGRAAVRDRQVAGRRPLHGVSSLTSLVAAPRFHVLAVAGDNTSERERGKFESALLFLSLSLSLSLLCVALRKNDFERKFTTTETQRALVGHAQVRRVVGCEPAASRTTTTTTTKTTTIQITACGTRFSQSSVSLG